MVGRDFLAASEIAEVSDGICFYVLDVGDEFGLSLIHISEPTRPY